MDMYKICLFLLVIIVAQLVTHYKERRDLYDRITGAPPKKNVEYAKVGTRKGFGRMAKDILIFSISLKSGDTE